MTFPLLVGTDGSKKMSQSLNNYISISDTAENIFGKIMSIPDEIMWDYFTMLTDLEISEIADLRNNVDKGKANPFEYKKMLGKLIVSEIYDENSASAAESSFENITINKNLPENMPEISIDDGIDVHLPNFLTENELTKSNSEARRLIESGSVKIDDQKIELLDINSSDLIGKTLQVGKRKFLKINKK